VTTIVVSGPLTRDEVVVWHEAFRDALARGGGLRLDLAGSGPWDLAGVQLLLAAVASARRAERPIVLARVPDVLTAVAERADLREQLTAISES
jgi:ABC-type transporter Mla MlaB component